MSLDEKELKILVNSFMSFEYVSLQNDVLMFLAKDVNVDVKSIWITNRLRRLVSIKPELYPIYIKVTGDKDSFKEFMAALENNRVKEVKDNG
ncbi:hypothetical protein HNP86_001080 [Methanococcus maripaludis]|uniref:Uncharacterized protein n=1 Tax=Methanococcus maripaludis TaxID=39152 RepID=A0A7J9NSQ0_METMI|nr:hypothetical protein [Methanococcus maripaludis]MBA2846491.1 hypothetical protein [Methanococcus maripaludis]MBA2850949.1 hypothetical protein [Methanococcus maripaludis]